METTNPKISVITCTVRPEGLPLVEKALKRQTFRDFEHIIQGKDYPTPEGYAWTLNHDMNVALRKAKGDLIVSWQDWTYTGPETLEKFWTHYEQHPNYLIGAVGNKYASDNFIIKTWQDPRERNDQGSFYPCYFSDIEYNLCSVPKKAFYDVGGWDEDLDRWFGMDGYSVNDRLAILGGYDFYLDQTIKSYSLEHGRPQMWEENNAIHGPYQEKRKSYVVNPVLNYL